MIGLRETLLWLDEIPGSLSAWQRSMFLDLYDPQTLPQRRLGIIDQLQHTADLQAGPYARLEILLHLALYCLAADQPQQAETFLSDLPEQFEKIHDVEHQAVALWLLALIDWEHCHVQNAFMRARKARGILINEYKKAEQVKNTVAQGRQGIRIGQMTYDLLSRPELIYWWMFEFGGEHFSDVTGQVRSNILDEIERQQMGQAQPAIARLRIMARHLGFEERCDVLGFCGYASLFLEGQHQALETLREAVEIASPNSHRQMVLLWMIGLMECRDHGRDCEGLRFQEKSIHQANMLRECCDQKNDQSRNLFYEFHLSAMKRVLEDNINGRLSPFGMRNARL